MAFVVIDEGESLESALRRFKRKVQQEAIIKEIKKHSVYYKPGEKKRMKQAQVNVDKEHGTGNDEGDVMDEDHPL